MNLTTVTSPKGEISVIDGLTSPIQTGGDLLDILMSSPSDTVAVNSDDLPAHFFELQTGLAGDMLQKISNYRRRMIILGDFENLQSKSLRDFIFESNQRGQVVFCDTLENAIAKLK